MLRGEDKGEEGEEEERGGVEMGSSRNSMVAGDIIRGERAKD
jgi:hypothetical protein